MPIITTFDPASAASEAIGAYSDHKRQNELEQQARDYQAKRDARRDMESDRTYTDAHAQTMSSLQTAEQQRKIAAAKEAYDEQMRPIELERARIQEQVERGELSQQQAQLALTKIQTQMASVDLKIKTQYGPREAAAALQQHQAEASRAQTQAQFAPQEAQASLDATRASTAATTQRTSQDAQRFPLQIQSDQLDVAGKRISNAGQDLQNTFARAQLKGPVADPNLEKDYRSQLTSYTARVNAFNKRAAANQLAPGETEPVPPMSPQDFTATLADSIDHLKANPADLNRMLAGVDAMPGLSAYQKRQAHLTLIAAMKAIPQQMQSVPYGLELRGGSNAGGPFQSVLRDAAQRHGVPLSIARALMGDESSGDPNAVSPAGAVGLLQLMGPAAKEMGVTDRRDPVQNINGGLAYLAKQYARFGSWPLALAAYNAGPENVAKYGMDALRVPGADPNYVTKILGGAR